MRFLTPLVVIIVVVCALVVHGSPDCGQGTSNSAEAKCRKDSALQICQKNHNRGSSSDEDSDSGEGDSGSDSHVDRNADGSSDSSTGDSQDLEDDWEPYDESNATTGASPLTPVTGATGATAATKVYHHNRYHCDLTDAVRNVSVVLDVEQKERLEKCMRDIEHFLSHAFGLSDVKKAAIAAHKLRKCLKKNGDISKLIAFEKVVTWGSIFDVTYVTIDLQADFCDAIILLDGSDDCILFEALRNATQGDIEKESAVLVLIEEIKSVLLDMSLSGAQKKAKIHDIFKLFFEVHVDWEEEFEDIEIEGFGPLGSFIDVTKGFKQSLSLSVVVSGSSDADCSLCAALSEAVANTSFSLSVRNQIKQFHDKLIVYFSSTVDIELRLTYVSQQYWQLIVVEPWIVEVMSLITMKDSQSGEDWGCFYDLIWVSQFCKNSGSCGCLVCGMGTSPAPTTAATTIAPAVCGTRPSLIVISAQNTTILTDVLTQNYNSWNASMRLGFNTCFNQVRTAIWNNVQFPTPAAKITECVRSFKAYNANNLDKQKVLMDIFIAKWNGKIGQFCDCGSG